MKNDKKDTQPKPFRTGESRAGDPLSATVTRDSDKFMLRLPDGMRDIIAGEAKKNGRSMNAEIVSRLIQSLEQTIDRDYRNTVKSKIDTESLTQQVLDLAKSRDSFGIFAKFFEEFLAAAFAEKMKQGEEKDYFDALAKDYPPKNNPNEKDS